MRAVADIVHLLALDVHAADEHRLRPFEILPGGTAEIFVDEADLPMRRQIGRDHEQALRRHEGLDAVGERIGIFERPESRCVARKHQQNATRRFDAFNPHQFPSVTPVMSTS